MEREDPKKIIQYLRNNEKPTTQADQLPVKFAEQVSKALKKSESREANQNSEEHSTS